ncbi:hypothetical protein ACFYOF_17130 [Streptomyces sp. NPDC007148]|uniref:hypothetical protein n=1 Tax=Streptomyces sp. NPDC007148 TaxID=3364775 RepID=UPI0036A82198
MTQQSEAERRRRTRILAATVVVAIIAGGSFLIGRMTNPEDSQGGALCDNVNAASKKLNDEIVTAPGNETQAVKDERGATLANLVLQNPGCFNASTRAQAQTLKDQIAARADSQAMSDAAARAAQCADPHRWTPGC